MMRAAARVVEIKGSRMLSLRAFFFSQVGEVLGDAGRLIFRFIIY